MRAMQPYEQGCACFRLCSEYDARAFHLRLPVVTTRESPWYHYLSFGLPADACAFASQPVQL